jgi:hypothetical protein
MILQKLKKIIKNRKNIFNGFLNLFLNKNKKIRNERLSLCRSNKCGKYDPKGKSKNAFVPGKESCGVCGCYLKALVADLESNCSLHQLNAK